MTAGELATPDTRADAYAGVVDALSRTVRHRAANATWISAGPKSPQEYDDLYTENDLAARICDIYPDEALRLGFSVRIPKSAELNGKNGLELAGAISTKLQELKFIRWLNLAATWARMVGAGVLFINIDDGRKVSEPVDEKNIQSVRWVRAYDRRGLAPKSFVSDPTDAAFGEVDVWSVTAQVGPTSVLQDIHRSRLLIIDGTKTTESAKALNSGFANSVLRRCTLALAEFGMSWQAAAHLMQIASQAVYGMTGLLDAIAEGREADMQARAQMLESMRSIMNAIVLDTGTEDEKPETFELHSVSWGGIPEILDRWMQRLSAASGIPVTRLFGRSPAGENATGEYDERSWNAALSSYRTHTLQDPIEVVVRYVMLSADGPTAGVEPSGWTICWPSLWEMTPRERADLEKATAEKDEIEIRAGMVLPEEAARSRHTEEGWSPETQIDLALRDEILSAEAMPTPDTPPTDAITTGIAVKKGAPEEAKDPTTALNGAQVLAMIDIVARVARRELPRASGVELILASFPVDRPTAEKVMGAVGTTFFVEAPPPAPPAAPVARRLDEALNPDQTRAATEILARVAGRQVTRAAGVDLLVGMGFDHERAEALMGDVGKETTP